MKRSEDDIWARPRSMDDPPKGISVAAASLRFRPTRTVRSELAPVMLKLIFGIAALALMPEGHPLLAMLILVVPFLGGAPKKQ